MRSLQNSLKQPQNPKAEPVSRPNAPTLSGSTEAVGGVATQTRAADTNTLPQHKDYKSANASLESSYNQLPGSYKFYHNLTDYDIVLHDASDCVACDIPEVPPMHTTETSKEGSVSFHQQRVPEFVVLDQKTFAKNRSFDSSSHQAFSVFSPNRHNNNTTSHFPPMQKPRSGESAHRPGISKTGAEQETEVGPSVFPPQGHSLHAWMMPR